MKRIALAILFALVPTLAFGQVVNWGDYQDSNQTEYAYFNTVGTDSVAETLTSGTLACYENGSATQFSTGLTLDNDFDSVTGFHQVAIDFSDANFETGKTYTVVLSGGTVDSVSVTGRIVAVFSVGRYADIDATNGVVQANIKQIDDDATAAANAEAFFDGTGYAGTGNTIPTVTTTTNVTTVNGLAANVITAASIAADAIGASEAAADLGADLASIPWNASWDAEVQSEANDAIVANNLDHLLLLAVSGTDVTDNSVIAKMTSKSATADWDSFVNTTDSLEAIRDNAGGGSGIDWDDLVADNDNVAGSFGKAIADILVDTGTSIPDSIADVAADVANLTPVAADVVDDSRTWFANDYRARNIVTVGDNFEGTLAIQPDLNPGTTIFTVDSVSITGAATVTATDLSTNRAKTRAQFTVPALTTTGTYTVVVTVTTIDGQVIPTTATLKVQ